MNFRAIVGASLLGISTLAGAQAGTIQTAIGGLNGLTNAYVTGNCGGECVIGSLTGSVLPTEVNYDTTVFSGATAGGGGVTPTPYAGYGTGLGGSLTDSLANGGTGVTFDMINEAGNANANAWFLPSGGPIASSVTIPVGVFGVTDFWTLSNTMLAGAGKRDLTIVLNFGASQGGTPTQTVTLRPLDTSNSGSPSGTDRDSVDCTSGAACTGSTPGSDDGAVGAPMNPFLMGPGAASGNVNGSPALTGTYGVSVYSDNLYSFAYTSATGAYANTAGNVVLDDQGWVFTGSLATLASNDWLESITIKDNGSDFGAGVFLSALTVDSTGAPFASSATPEPSTILMFLSGLGAIGFSRIRRRK